MISSEFSEICGFVMWFRRRYPDVLIYHTPNGEHRSISSAVRLKQMGVVPGIPDLHVPFFNTWIEMKRSDGGTLSAHQQRIIKYLREECGHHVIVAHGATDASRQIIEFAKKNKYE